MINYENEIVDHHEKVLGLHPFPECTVINAFNWQVIWRNSYIISQVICLNQGHQFQSFAILPNCGNTVKARTRTMMGAKMILMTCGGGGMLGTQGTQPELQNVKYIEWSKH